MRISVFFFFDENACGVGKKDSRGEEAGERDNVENKVAIFRRRVFTSLTMYCCVKTPTDLVN